MSHFVLGPVKPPIPFIHLHKWVMPLEGSGNLNAEGVVVRAGNKVLLGLCLEVQMVI